MSLTLKKDYVYKLNRKSDSYVFVVTDIDYEQHEIGRFSVTTKQLTKSKRNDIGHLNFWHLKVNSQGLTELGHKDLYPEYFI